MDNQIFVTGATGKQGRALIHHLHKYEQKIKVMTRDPSKAKELEKMGVEIVQGDLLDRSSLDKALGGVKKMFLVATPYDVGGVEAEIRQGMNGVDAAKAAGVEYLVYSSVGSANRNTGIPHFESKWKIEEHIRELKFEYFILRPVFFMDNFSTPWMLPALQNGKLSLPLKANRKLAMAAVDDIGNILAQAFMHPDKFLGRELEFGGEELTFPAALDLIHGRTGKTITYQEMPEEGSEKILGNDTAAMYKWFNAVGYNPNIEGIEKEFGIRLKRFADYLKTAPWLSQLTKPTPVKHETGQ